MWEWNKSGLSRMTPGLLISGGETNLGTVSCDGKAVNFGWRMRWSFKKFEPNQDFISDAREVKWGVWLTRKRQLECHPQSSGKYDHIYGKSCQRQDGNKRWPRTEPWGTPMVTREGLDSKVLRWMIREQCERQEWNSWRCVCDVIGRGSIESVRRD